MNKKTGIIIGVVVVLLAVGGAVAYAHSKGGAQSSKVSAGSTRGTYGFGQHGQYGNGSGTTTGQGGMRGMMPNLPVGEKPFFGTVSAVTPTQITVTSMARRPNTSGASGGSPAQPTSAAPTTTTILLNSSTQFTGGTQATLASGTRVFGVDKTNADGTLTAVSVQINPAMPSGGAGRGGIYNGGNAGTGGVSGGGTTQ